MSPKPEEILYVLAMQLLALRRFLRKNRGAEVQTFRNIEILDLFLANFPILMRHVALCIAEQRREDNSLANFGLTIPYAWLPDVYLLCRRLERIAEQIMAEYPEQAVPYLANIKEKWRSLRVYVYCTATPNEKKYTELTSQMYEQIELTEARYRHED